MKFCNFREASSPADTRPVAGVMRGERIVRVADLIPGTEGVQDRDGLPLPLGYFDGRENNLRHLHTWCAALAVVETGDAHGYDEAELHFAPPVHHPANFRDFYAFEKHVANARALRGLTVPSEWYELPVFYFSNPGAFITHGDELPAPRGGTWLDFELEVAAVLIGSAANPDEVDAEALIGGYCLLNDFSLRDVQRREMAVGLGPAKGKDFASGLGPWLVTPDELSDRRSGTGFDLAMRVSVNGLPLANGNWKKIHYSFARMIARAGENVLLRPGDIIGSGTVGTGCILELGPENVGGWLQPGDTVEIEIERLGRQAICITAHTQGRNPE